MTMSLSEGVAMPPITSAVLLLHAGVAEATATLAVARIAPQATPALRMLNRIGSPGDVVGVRPTVRRQQQDMSLDDGAHSKMVNSTVLRFSERVDDGHVRDNSPHAMDGALHPRVA
ncbi:hypothetical protein [Mycolicibacterium psychrotolerans]|uniref:hypothetical protein n=1 Tax=Mycolicibacterium psychrotolerans TaxID=216929 RepID=UPI001FEB275D|nr:hypothetical protein [Mycolicibacterium psychrotolerans]